ncbi:MAG: type V CRISPR-associated endonuclease Cas1 [Phycisphaerae bacterium]|nr:type V CRISPR-associated endonuclease Cas1 [Phycisphaerae bacterium]
MLSAPEFKQKQILFALLSHGEKLSFKNDNIIIKDADGKIKHQSTCYRLFAIFVIGHISITSGLLQRAEKFGFTIVLMTHSLRVYGSWCCPARGNVMLRKKQYDYKALDIAHHIVANKIDNQLNTLKALRNKNDKLKDSIASIKQYRLAVVTTQPDLQELLGLEGIVSRQYFQAYFADLNWIARRPRVKHDTINCLMDIGYTLLFNMIEGLLNIYGFDLYKGIYHQQFYQRKSLVCDLVEPFRPLIDARIRKAHSLGQVNEDDFYIKQGQYSLFGKQASPYIAWLLEPLMARKQEIFLYVQSYYRSFMKNKPLEQYPVFKI